MIVLQLITIICLCLCSFALGIFYMRFLKIDDTPYKEKWTKKNVKNAINDYTMIFKR